MGGYDLGHYNNGSGDTRIMSEILTPDRFGSHEIKAYQWEILNVDQSNTQTITVGEPLTVGRTNLYREHQDD